MNSEEKEKLSYVDRNVVLLFPDELNEQFISLSESINQQVPSRIVLNKQDTLPHLTIYEARYPMKNIQNVELTLEDLVKSQKPFVVRFRGNSVIAGTIFIDAEISDDLYRLHEQVVDNLNDFREGLFPEEELELPGLTAGMHQSLLSYGSLLAKGEYLSHVTVARPVDSERCREALLILPRDINIEGIITSIRLVESGVNGTCRRVLQTYPFGNK